MKEYSILMSVYHGEKAVNFEEAVHSMMTQTVLTNDFVIVCDGELTEELDQVIDKYVALYPGIFNIIRIPKSPNWAHVLNVGLKACKNELVARMDSDDISVPDRCEKQILFLESHPEVDCVSTSLGEFFESPKKIDNVRSLPEKHGDIAEFAKRRCPLNHATVIYKKTSVIKSGAYKYFPAYEDYHLWIRMLKKGCILHNMPEVLYLMRAGLNLYERRRGWKYCKEMLKFRLWMKKLGMINLMELVVYSMLNAIVLLMPNGCRAFVYQKFLRDKKNA